MRFDLLILHFNLTVQVIGNLLFIDRPLVSYAFPVFNIAVLVKAWRADRLFQIVYRCGILSGNAVFLCLRRKVQFLSIIRFYRIPIQFRTGLRISARPRELDFQVSVERKSLLSEETKISPNTACSKKQKETENQKKDTAEMPLFLPGRGFRDGLFGNLLYRLLSHRLLYLRYRIDRAAF